MSTPSTELAKQDPFTKAFVESLTADTGAFEGDVKKMYSECVITKTHTRFDNLVCGPGYVAAHIVPQKFWYAFPNQFNIHSPEIYPQNVTPSSVTTQESDLRTRMSSTWMVSNGLLLRSDIHEMFDRRLIAIHPVTHKVRLFAAMPSVIQYHGNIIQWEGSSKPSFEALSFHYEQCVLENVGAHATGLVKHAVRNIWLDTINNIARKAQLPVSSATERLSLGVDGGADLDDARGHRSTNREKIISWLEKFNI
ncbi:hypothetical protein TWF696_002117 [Orbilia brochopaga]|uniref:HNH nuclease domain-containing protein n=1 Tax=Orbilia brochopaga TaxID=3140254 RepID=A0AAV9UAS8_9PEZI